MADYWLWTKQGRPIAVHGADLFDSTGKHLARRRDDRVYDSSGRYAGTIVDDRVVYRSTHSSRRGPTFARRARGGFGKGSRGARGLWGDEPFQD